MIFILCLGVVLIIYKLKDLFIKSSTPSHSKPPITEKPTKVIDNDFVVLVDNIKPDYIKEAIQRFYDLYNQNEYKALPRLYIINNQGIITFPYNIEFETFCYFINFITYPIELGEKSDYNPIVKGWCTTKVGDTWVNDHIVNQKVQLFIPKTDDEYDNVYLITEGNLIYKLGFSVFQNLQQIEDLDYSYSNCPFDKAQLKQYEFMDFE
ncbi:MAG: hypothetical protein H6586_02135 [Flavobacteriales bacterium]|nr:hypothetical protein [Flavobacteriales bacterium]